MQRTRPTRPILKQIPDLPACDAAQEIALIEARDQKLVTKIGAELSMNGLQAILAVAGVQTLLIRPGTRRGPCAA